VRAKLFLALTVFGQLFLAGYAAHSRMLADHDSHSLFLGSSIAPVEFLIVSSPLESKVCYAELEYFKAKNGRTQPLIDSGLRSPKGIALDTQRGFLYVTDDHAKKIFRYTIIVQQTKDEKSGQIAYTLATDGIRLTIVENAQTSWVAVDSAGDIFYTDQTLNSVNKITLDVINKLASGEFTASGLTVQSEQSQEATASADASAATHDGPLEIQSEQASSVRPIISALYEATANARVSMPAGIVTTGGNIFWGNSANGKVKGAVIKGEATPTAPLQQSSGSEAASFDTQPLGPMNTADSVFGVTTTHNTIVFTAEDKKVYGVTRSGGTTDAVVFSDSFSKPRGLAWDGDNTVYVADQADGAVYSFPCGRLSKDQPRARVVTLRSAFGLTLLRSNDPAFWRGGAKGSSPTGCILGFAFLVFAVAGAVL